MQFFLWVLKRYRVNIPTRLPFPPTFYINKSSGTVNININAPLLQSLALPQSPAPQKGRKSKQMSRTFIIRFIASLLLLQLLLLLLLLLLLKITTHTIN